MTASGWVALAAAAATATAIVLGLILRSVMKEREALVTQNRVAQATMVLAREASESIQAAMESLAVELDKAHADAEAARRQVEQARAKIVKAASSPEAAADLWNDVMRGGS